MSDCSKLYSLLFLLISVNSMKCITAFLCFFIWWVLLENVLKEREREKKKKKKKKKKRERKGERYRVRKRERKIDR